ncbi:hypothetical protein [Tropicimonas sp. IMCC34043]|uniref:hypothetical protein n=1 Tax=Tropicimonas sp. IMCC34043 TaxID=2248760 RepID=UPI000E222444|nr:hypothetical protein [Tropicimonas sp. IMCC34043]
MPDYAAIFAYYQAMAVSALTGAMPGECAIYAKPELDAVIEGFLDPKERRILCCRLGPDRAVRLQKGQLRFTSWQAANPDIVAVLKRKALVDAVVRPDQLARVN